MEIKVCNNVEIKSRLVCLENSGIQKVWREMELCHTCFQMSCKRVWLNSVANEAPLKIC